MRRRTFIASSAGALAALTGCLDDAGGGPNTDAPTDEPTETPDDPSPTDDGTPEDTASPPTGTASDADVTVDSIHLQYGVVIPDSPDSIGVWSTDTPYVVASVAVEGSLSRDDFALAVGDESVAPTTHSEFYRTSWGDEEWYERGRDSGLLLFDLSGVAPGDVRLTWPGGERPLDASARERLERGPPQFTARLDVPDTHDGTDAPPVEVEVTNEGDAPARFLGALNRVGPMVAYTPVARLSELVSADETTTVEVADDWGDATAATPGDGDPDVTYHLSYAGGEDSAEIRIVESA